MQAGNQPPIVVSQHIAPRIGVSPLDSRSLAPDGEEAARLLVVVASRAHRNPIRVQSRTHVR